MRSLRRPAKARRAPSLAKAMAHARPMPLPAPVTIPTLSFKRSVMRMIVAAQSKRGYCARKRCWFLLSPAIGESQRTQDDLHHAEEQSDAQNIIFKASCIWRLLVAVESSGEKLPELVRFADPSPLKRALLTMGGLKFGRLNKLNSSARNWTLILSVM